MAGLTVKVRADASEFERTMGKVRKEIGGLKSGMMGIAGAAAGILAVGKAMDVLGDATGKVIDFMKQSSAEAGKMESLKMSFETLTGSSSAARAMIAEFRKEAQKSPLSVSDYAEAGKLLMAFGSSAEDVMPTLKMLGDVSMGNSARFGQLALAFAQTKAAGRLMGQEVLQFVNAGFNPLQKISQKTGESMLTLKKRMEDGGVSAAEVAEAFKSATMEGGQFFGAINRGAETMEGKVAKLKDAWQTLQVAFGSGLNVGLKAILDKVNEELPMLEAKFQEIGSIMGNIIKLGVEGDPQGFILVGETIGDAIGLGLKKSARAALDSVSEMVFGAAADWYDMMAIGGLQKLFTGKAGGQDAQRAAIEQNRFERGQMGNVGDVLREGYQGLQNYRTRPASEEALISNRPSTAPAASSPDMKTIADGVRKISALLGGPLPN